MTKLTVAICTYNRAERLPDLLSAIREQVCSVPFDILFINNNSTDNTAEVLESLGLQPGALIRTVFEGQQGIVHARNRAIQEAVDSDYLFFIDDDECPKPGWLTAGLNALEGEEADCVGGRVRVNFNSHDRPLWLDEELLGFLAEVDHGEAPLWITDRSTQIWTANVAYKLDIFRKDPGLRFDLRYNRVGNDIGGGEDTIMFLELLSRQMRIRYRPDMEVEHFVEPWRLRRRYFLRLHYRAGVRVGHYRSKDYPSQVFGVPLFLVRQLMYQCFIALKLHFQRKPGTLRQAMTAANTLGVITGRILRWKTGETRN